jgi:hypothetical protein
MLLMHFYIIIALALLCLPIGARSQVAGDSLIVEMRDGTRITTAVRDIEKITFDSVTSNVDQTPDASLSSLTVLELGPARFIFNYFATNTGPIEYRITDVQGKLVARQSIFGSRGVNRMEWNGKSLDGQLVPRGVYFVAVSTTSETAYAKLTILP